MMNSNRCLQLLLTALPLLVTGCSDDAPSEGGSQPSAESRAPKAESRTPFRFTDVTADTGIETILTSGNLPHSELLEVKKGGIALVDFNNDGRQDIFVATGATFDNPEHGPGWQLYENLGNFRFRNITRSAGITHTRWAMGACVGDFTGNGFDDIYVTCYGPNVLLRNNGDGTFTDVTNEAGVGDPRWSTTCAWGDITGDGKLDLYVANFMAFDHENPPPRSVHKGVEVMSGPFGIPAEHDVLYRNNGDGTFADITESSGCRPREACYGLNVAILDFTGDGRQDIYVGNDSTPNFLFVNQGDGTFAERGRQSGLATNIDGSVQATMGVAIGDLTGNGLPDIFTTNFASDTNTLHINIDGQFFDDQTQRWGLAFPSRPYLGWAAEFIDLNHDGVEELFMVNGHVYPQATVALMDSEYLQPPLLFQRRGNRFERVDDEAAGEWLFRKGRDRAAIFADMNDDGAMDVVIGELNARPRILRNDGADPAGKWLIVELNDRRDGITNHRGLGSRVQATFDRALGTGDRGQERNSPDAASGTSSTWTRWIFSGACYQGSRAPYAHFGFPPSVNEVVITIQWPDGAQQTVEGIALNQRITIERE